MWNVLGLSTLVLGLMIAGTCLCLALKFNEEGRLRGSVVSLVFMLSFGGIAALGLLAIKL